MNTLGGVEVSAMTFFSAPLPSPHFGTHPTAEADMNTLGGVKDSAMAFFSAPPSPTLALTPRRRRK